MMPSVSARPSESYRVATTARRGGLHRLPHFPYQVVALKVSKGGSLYYLSRGKGKGSVGKICYTGT